MAFNKGEVIIFCVWVWKIAHPFDGFPDSNYVIFNVIIVYEEIQIQLSAIVQKIELSCLETCTISLFYSFSYEQFKPVIKITSSKKGKFNFPLHAVLPKCLAYFLTKVKKGSILWYISLHLIVNLIWKIAAACHKTIHNILFLVFSFFIFGNISILTLLPYFCKLSHRRSCFFFGGSKTNMKGRNRVLDQSVFYKIPVAVFKMEVCLRCQVIKTTRAAFPILLIICILSLLMCIEHNWFY